MICDKCGMAYVSGKCPKCEEEKQTTPPKEPIKRDKAIVILLLGIFSLLGGREIFCLLAALTSIVLYFTIKDESDRKNRRLVNIGLVLSIISLFLSVFGGLLKYYGVFSK